ncbi:chorismate synthase [Candidatus Falkowbacteria bacterium RBG_13_39_14]|uniref:Chorismate synthase n=1 Tax=Candidatus Falkowbacteria bacterium RBG_13_39_14 TaxID=1797985 RepID=A0A1F5S5A5_9BACT|nr:MAG: chorismate synthase [Candidatus Falkowbacteria bacterium RBG_13_39_14]
MGNSFGKIFKITTFGESHGKAIGVVIDGCPAGLEIAEKDIQAELDKRRPGQSKFTTQRNETDKVEILSGIFEGKTLGAPIAIVIYNNDSKSKHYEDIKDLYRPGHADYTYEAKYGIRDWRGGGRASARETAARVAAGAIAKKILADAGIMIAGYVIQIGKLRVENIDEQIVYDNPLRCPDNDMIKRFEEEIENARKDGDSVGGIVEIAAHNVPAGLGEPVFNKLSADLAQGIMSIPAVKGFEIGDGFASSSRRGSENNDEWNNEGGKIKTATNRAGGIIGGISTGEDIIFRFALKPTPSIRKKQKTVDKNGEEREIEIQGRHDPCVCPRAVPVGEAMAALVLVDHWLLNRISRNLL